MNWCILGHSTKTLRGVIFCKRCGSPFESLHLAYYIISRKKHTDWVNKNYYTRWRMADVEMTREEYEEFL